MDLVVKRFEELSVKELYKILQVRVAVFVVEQNCVYQEVDDKDQYSYHVVLKDNTGIKAYLRVIDKGVSFEDVSIGRVLTLERGCGLGNKILFEGIKVAKERMNADRIIIEAQSYAKEFYEKAGFKQTSEEFLEDGIPHIQMVLE
ncbi:ElaA protein [Sedimentibacter acidaminivorans]|uniref:ElaA protein n=1 Tax=Sedimentibacter acidaminivorans TaxID=913099 RepID=A0ABS4GBI8_9FIRM|nr:GNAT family N-acetyltransferase [Sedimentibacter acidaminivorans]MBP1924765.1 ElaA protein [Sedimentibacter acidaminivorans]